MFAFTQCATRKRCQLRRRRRGRQGRHGRALRQHGAGHVHALRQCSALWDCSALLYRSALWRCSALWRWCALSYRFALSYRVALCPTFRGGAAFRLREWLERGCGRNVRHHAAPGTVRQKSGPNGRVLRVLSQTAVVEHVVARRFHDQARIARRERHVAERAHIPLRLARLPPFYRTEHHAAFDQLTRHLARAPHDRVSQRVPCTNGCPGCKQRSCCHCFTLVRKKCYRCL
jgi:hypothetical protein